MTLKQKYAKRRAKMAALTRQGYNISQIAAKYKISRQAVSQLLQKASEEGNIVVKTKRKNAIINSNVVLVNKRIKSYVCVICKRKFSNRTKKATCSKKCAKKHKVKGGKWSRYEFITLNCSGCKKSFTRSNYIHQITLIHNPKNHYCSQKCYLEFGNKKTN